MPENDGASRFPVGTREPYSQCIHTTAEIGSARRFQELKALPRWLSRPSKRGNIPAKKGTLVGLDGVFEGYLQQRTLLHNCAKPDRTARERRFILVHKTQDALPVKLCNYNNLARFCTDRDRRPGALNWALPIR